MTLARKAAARLSTGSANLCTGWGRWLAADGLLTGVGRLLSSLAALAFLALTVYGSPAMMWAVAAGWILAAARAGGEATDDDVDDQEQPEPDDTEDEQQQLLAALHELADPHVHLKPLAQRLGHGDTARVRALLREAGVPIADGVRMRGRGVSPGVRARDLPPLPTDHDPTPVADVVPGQASNDNSNNAHVSRTREGLWIIQDPDNPRRHHVAKTVSPADR